MAWLARENVRIFVFLFNISFIRAYFIYSKNKLMTWCHFQIICKYFYKIPLKYTYIYKCGGQTCSIAGVQIARLVFKRLEIQGEGGSIFSFPSCYTSTIRFSFPLHDIAVGFYNFNFFFIAKIFINLYISDNILDL